MLIISKLRKVSLLKNASIYTGSNIFSALVPFICMPVLTRYLTPEDYGIVAIMGSLISFLTPFVGLNIDGAIAANYYHDSDNFTRFVKNCNSILVISSLVVVALIYIFSEYISSYTLFPSDWLWSLVMICVCQFVYGVHLTMLQMKQQALNYGILQVLTVIFNSGLSIFLVVVLSMNWQGRVLAQVITVLAFMMGSIYYFSKNGLLGLAFDREYINKALNFGVPLIPHAIAGSLLTVVDRFFIANYVDIGVAGLFVLGAQIGSGMELLTSSFNKAYVPWLFKQLKNITYERKCKIVRYTYLYFLSVILIAIVYSLALPYLLVIFVGEKFYASAQFVWPFAFAGAINGMYYMVVNYIFFTGHTAQLMYRTLLVGIIHTLLSYILTCYYGVVGACWCVLISHSVMFFIVWNLSNNVFKMPWFDKSIFQKSK